VAKRGEKNVGGLWGGCMPLACDPNTSPAPPPPFPFPTSLTHFSDPSHPLHPPRPTSFLAGDWTARVWTDDTAVRTPILTTKYHNTYLTGGTWSPTRPGEQPAGYAAAGRGVCACVELKE
jgi:hypothetical protein